MRDRLCLRYLTRLTRACSSSADVILLNLIYVVLLCLIFDYLSPFRWAARILNAFLPIKFSSSLCSLGWSLARGVIFIYLGRLCPIWTRRMIVRPQRTFQTKHDCWCQNPPLQWCHHSHWSKPSANDSWFRCLILQARGNLFNKSMSLNWAKLYSC